MEETLSEDEHQTSGPITARIHDDGAQTFALPSYSIFLMAVMFLHLPCWKEETEDEKNLFREVRLDLDYKRGF
jgi:hypothetical protein